MRYVAIAIARHAQAGGAEAIPADGGNQRSISTEREDSPVPRLQPWHNRLAQALTTRSYADRLLRWRSNLAR